MITGAISNIKESWTQVNEVDPCSIIDDSHKNTRWIYVLEKFIRSVTRTFTTREITKDDDATVGPRYSIQTAQNV